MALLTLTINNPTPALDKRHQESQLIQRALHLALVDIRINGGGKATGNITDDGARVIGSWVYTPQASS
jgi:hypothetical protein